MMYEFCYRLERVEPLLPYTGRIATVQYQKMLFIHRIVYRVSSRHCSAYCRHAIILVGSDLSSSTPNRGSTMTGSRPQPMMFAFIPAIMVTFCLMVYISLFRFEEPAPIGVLTLEEFRQTSRSMKTSSRPPAKIIASPPLLRGHPHAGALDEHGNPGYIHDPTYIRKHPLEFNYRPDAPSFSESVCDMPPGQGIEGSAGIHGLRKINIMTEVIPTKVMCIVYTHSNAHAAVKAVVETYGQRCDGFMAASNLTDKTIGAVNILHQGPEAYGNMWQKVRSTWAYVHDNYVDDYDWFHIGGDNMFVIAENLRYAGYQETMRQQTHHGSENWPIYMGGAMVLPPRRKWRLCGGGSGYTLNRQALAKMVMEEFDKPHCAPETETSKEDLFMANCLRPQVANCTHSIDDMLETRYHPYDVEFHTIWKKWKVSNWHWEILEKTHRIRGTSKEGLESIASSTVSFHLTGHKNITTQFRDMGVRRYHAILYHLCSNHKNKPFDPNIKIER